MPSPSLQPMSLSLISNENIFSLVSYTVRRFFVSQISAFCRQFIHCDPTKIGACLHWNSSFFAKNSTFYLKMPHLFGPTNVIFLSLLERRSHKFVNFERRFWKKLIDGHLCCNSVSFLLWQQNHQGNPSSETELRLILLQYYDLPPLITVEDRWSLSSEKLAWPAVSSPTAKISVYQWLPLLQDFLQ